MAGLTQALTFVINSRTEGAVRGLKAVERELDLLEKDAKQAGVAFDRVGERNAKLTPLQGAISGISAKTGIAESTIRSFGTTAAVAGAAFVSAFAVKSIQAASHFNETLSRTNVLFGESTKIITDFAASADTSLGLSKQQALDAADSFGGLFLTIGKGKQEAASLGVALAALAADLASAFDTDVASAANAIASGLRGESEPLRQFNVLLDEATLKQEALRLGLVATTTQALSPAIKAQAAYSVILAQTGSAQGDFARTSEGLAGQTKILKAEFANLTVEIGEKLIPAATELVGVAIDVVDGLGKIAHAIDVATDRSNDFIDSLGKAGSFLRSAFGGSTPALQAVDRKKQAEHEAAVATAEHAKQVEVVNAQIAEEAKRLYAAQAATIAMRGGLTLAAQGALKAAASYTTFGNTVFGAMQRAIAGIAGVLSYQERLANFNAVSSPQTIFGGLNEFLDGITTSVNREVSTQAASGIASGVGSSEVEAAVDDFGDYLRAVAEQRLSSLDNVFAGLSSKLNFDDAASSLQEAIDKLAALKAESANLKGDIAGQQSLVGSLLAQSLTITPTEQVAIEQAEKNLADTLARFKGTITQATAPSSSFLGPTTTDVFNAPTASLAELQVAEERLAEAKATAVGPTRELEAAEKALVDMRERQRDLPKLIADANRDLTKAQLALVDAQRQLNDAGQALIDQGPEFTTWFQTIATQAGLTGAALAGFTANLTAAMRAGGGAKGLVDVFGNGTRFASPSDANDILSYISGQFGGPRINKFAGGGLVPGYPGQPQMILAHGGERVSQAGAGGGGSIVVNVNAGMGADGQAIARYVHQELLALQRRSGRLGLN